MSQKARAVSIGGAAVLGACTAFLACSSFDTADDEPSNGADAATDRPTGGDATGGDDADTDARVKGDGGSSGAVLVATSANPVPWITYDATRVIWSTGSPQAGNGGDGAVVSACPKLGCNGSSPAVIASNVPTGSLGTTGSTAFIGFSKFNRPIERIEASGTTSLSTVSARNALFNFATHDGALFFMTYAALSVVDGGPATFTRTVHALALPDGPDSKIGDYQGVGVNTANFAVTADRVFIGAHNTGLIVTCERTNCQYGTFGSGDDYYVSSLATSGARLYWVTNAIPNTTALVSCAPGATCSTLKKELTPPRESRILAVEYYDRKLYYQTAAGDLFECPADDCASKPRLLAHEDAFYVQALAARNLVVDDVNVYYVAMDGSADAGNLSYRVMRVPR